MTGQDLEVWPSYLAVPAVRLAQEQHPTLRLFLMCELVEATVRWFSALAITELLRLGEGSLPADLVRELGSKTDVQRPAFGTWVQILKACFAAVERTSGDVTPAMWEGQVVAREVLLPLLDRSPSFLTLRNDLAHGGGTTRARSERLLAEGRYAERIEAAFARLAPWLASTAVVGRALDGSFELLAGVHRRPAPEAIAARLAEVAPGSVYWVTGDRLLDLSPLCRFAPAEQDQGRGGTSTPQLYRQLKDRRTLVFTTLDDDKPKAESRNAEVLARFRAIFALDRPDDGSAFEVEAHRDAACLVGREKELAHLLASTRDPGNDGRVLWLPGPPGIGKTTLIAATYVELTRVPRDGELVFFHRFAVGDPRCSRDDFLRRATGSLRRWLRQSDPTYDLGGEELERHFRELVDTVPSDLTDAVPARRAILIVDGVDEIARIDPPFVNLILGHATRGVTWLCAGRPDLAVNTLFEASPLTTLALDGPVPPLNASDVRALLLSSLEREKYEVLALDDDHTGQVTNPFIELVTKRANGLPIYVQLVIEDLERGALDPRKAGRFLPPTLEAYYERVIQSLSLGDLQTILTPIVVLLALAKQPLPPAVAHALLSTANRAEPGDSGRELIERALAALSSLVRIVAPSDTGEAEGYTLYHESFREHVLGNVTFAATVRMVNDHFCRLAEAWAAAPHELQRYLLSHGPSHLMDANRSVEAERLLTSYAHLHARLVTFGPSGLSALLSDLDRGEAIAGNAIAVFGRFFHGGAHLLRRGDATWGAERILLQIALEQDEGSLVSRAAHEWLKTEESDFISLRQMGPLSSIGRSPWLRMQLEGHGREVHGALVAADGTLVTWSADRSLRRWDLGTGVCLATFVGHASAVRGAVLLTPS